MTVLVPMRAESYRTYLEAAVAGYADDNVAAKRWPETGALERSRAEFDTLLPQGLETPDNFLYEIMAAEHGPGVGYLWVAIEQRHGSRSVFVYDIEIKPQWQRQGHAKRALIALEQIVRELGLDSVGLHVFSQNVGAQALYSKLGYTATGINMVKRLAASGCSLAPTDGR